MTNTDRYTGPGRRGANRPLTNAERTQWSGAVATWHNDPPWTDQARTDNDAVRTMAVTLFEDGVSVADLATAANWGKPKVAGILHRARQSGLGTGSRRYIEPTPTAKQAEKAAKEPFRRALTADEATTLTAAYQSLPVHARGARGWKNETGAALLTTIMALVEDDVALGTIGDLLGMSRQAIHDRLAKAKTAQTTQSDKVLAA